MTTPQIGYVALASGLMLVWLILVVRGPRKFEIANVLAVLRYGVAWRTAALVLALAPALVAVYAIWAFLWRTPQTLHLAGIAFLTFSVLGGLLLIEVTRVQIVVTDEGLTRFSPWSGTLTLKWIDVESVGYSAINRWFVVAGQGQTIRVSRYLGGIETFVETVWRKVASERSAGAGGAMK